MRSVTTVLLFALACLIVLMKFGRTTFYRAHIAQSFAAYPLPTLHPFLWTALSSVTTRIVAPVAFVILVLRERPSEFGYRLGGGGTFLRIYGLLLVLMVPILWSAAGSSAFQAKYPLWDGAGESWSHLLIFETRYFFIFLSGEAFWRGFLLFGLVRRFGWHALSISMVPYVLVHFGKPPIETLGAIVTAYVLGYLALKHRSFALGVALHFTVALLMDVFALIRSGHLPSSW